MGGLPADGRGQYRTLVGTGPLRLSAGEPASAGVCCSSGRGRRRGRRSLHVGGASSTAEAPPAPAAPPPPIQHPAWTDDASWKHRLTNLRLLLQPFVCACLLLPWLCVYPLPHLTAELADLCALMNTYHPLFPK